MINIMGLFSKIKAAFKKESKDVNTYEKDKLINRRQEILDIIKNGQGFSEEELNNLEDELSNIVIKLKK
jgi:hypothetical protein